MRPALSLSLAAIALATGITGCASSTTTVKDGVEYTLVQKSVADAARDKAKQAYQAPSGASFVMVQPRNFKQECKLPFDKDAASQKNFVVYWQGKCSDGQAIGEGRAIGVSDDGQYDELAKFTKGFTGDMPYVARDYKNKTTIAGKLSLDEKTGNSRFVGTYEQLFTDYNFAAYILGAQEWDDNKADSHFTFGKNNVTGMLTLNTSVDGVPYTVVDLPGAGAVSRFAYPGRMVTVKFDDNFPVLAGDAGGWFSTMVGIEGKIHPAKITDDMGEIIPDNVYWAGILDKFDTIGTVFKDSQAAAKDAKLLEQKYVKNFSKAAVKRAAIPLDKAQSILNYYTGFDAKVRDTAANLAAARAIDRENAAAAAKEAAKSAAKSASDTAKTQASSAVSSATDAVADKVAGVVASKVASKASDNALVQEAVKSQVKEQVKSTVKDKVNAVVNGESAKSTGSLKDSLSAAADKATDSVAEKVAAKVASKASDNAAVQEAVKSQVKEQIKSTVKDKVNSVVSGESAKDTTSLKDKVSSAADKATDTVADKVASTVASKASDNALVQEAVKAQVKDKVKSEASKVVNDAVQKATSATSSEGSAQK